MEDKNQLKMNKKNIFCPIITSKDIGGGIKSTISLLNGLAALQYNVTVLIPKDCEFVSKFEPTVNVPPLVESKPNIGFRPLSAFAGIGFKYIFKSSTFLSFDTCVFKPASKIVWRNNWMFSIRKINK